MKPRHLNKIRSLRSDVAARRSKQRPAPDESLTRAMCVWVWKKRPTDLVLHFAQEGIGGSRADNLSPSSITFVLSGLRGK